MSDLTITNIKISKVYDEMAFHDKLILEATINGEDYHLSSFKGETELARGFYNTIKRMLDD